MKFKQWLLTEVRLSFLQYLKEKLPHVPSYVLQDFFYKNLKNSTKEEIQEFLDMYKNFKWQLVKNFPISYDIFDDQTLNKLKIRKGGKENPFNVPKDSERHQVQANLISKSMPQEPIILLKNGSKYELLEGWHRTIQLFEKYPNGFNYPQVYIATN